MQVKKLKVMVRGSKTIKRQITPHRSYELWELTLKKKKSRAIDSALRTCKLKETRHANSKTQ